MAEIKFETLVITSYGGQVIDLLYGKGQGLLQTLRNSEHWDTIAEELQENGHFEPITTCEELASIHHNNEIYSIRVELFTEQKYFS